MIYQYDGSKDKCPLPLVNMRVMLKKMKDEDTCVIKIADEGSLSDIPKYLSEKGYKYSMQALTNGITELRISTGK